MFGRCFETNFGWCGAICKGESVIKIWLPIAERREIEDAIAAFGVVANTPTDIEPAIIRYFEGESVDFSMFSYKLTFTGFSFDLLSALTAIPYGKTMSYAEIAALAGHAGKYRAAGQALRRNPLPIILPCHRVVRIDGKAGGFMGREDSSLKARMLQMEQSLIRSC